MSALDKQVGGDHYKQRGIQPVQYIHANALDFFQGNVVKYITRWRDKGGLADLEKCKHYLELYIELETIAANLAAQLRRIDEQEAAREVVVPLDPTFVQTMNEQIEEDCQHIVNQLDAVGAAPAVASDLYASDRRANE